MLYKGQHGNTSTGKLPELGLIKEIIEDELEDPDVRIAGIQALQVINRPDDEIIKPILKRASQDVNSEVRRLANKALAGEHIPLHSDGRGNELMAKSSLDDLTRMISNPATLQQKLDAMEEAGVRGVGNAETYELIARTASKVDISHLTGQRHADAQYIRQAALWTLGLLNKGQHGNVSTNELPGLAIIKAIVEEEREDPEVRIAGIQALQVINRSDDKTIRAVLRKASQDTNSHVKYRAQRALAGECISLPSGLL